MQKAPQGVNLVGLWCDSQRRSPARAKASKITVVVQQHLMAEHQKVVQMMGQYVEGDGQLQALIVVDCHIAKTHHAFHLLRYGRREPVGLRQQSEGVSGALRDAQSFASDDVQAHVQGGFAGALNIEDGRVLTAEVVRKTLRVCCLFLAGTRHAALNGGGFVDQHIIGHTRILFASRLRSMAAWLRPNAVFQSAWRLQTNLLPHPWPKAVRLPSVFGVA